MFPYVATLTNRMKQMMETIGQLNANPVIPIESKALKLAIREEVKEMEEREKRKSSVVVGSAFCYTVCRSFWGCLEV